MIQFKALIKKFDDQGEKTGWRYVEVSAEIANQLKPNHKKSFRVKGKLDDYLIEKTALLPMGEGNFIIPISAAIRKKLYKQAGDTIQVKLEEDNREIGVPADFAECMADEPAALEYFNKQPGSHRNYYVKWIDSAKTVETRSKRIAMAIIAMANGMDYGQMIRANKQEK
jgi:hypothetical protein